MLVSCGATLICALRRSRRREQDRREQDRCEEGRVAAARRARDLVGRVIQRSPAQQHIAERLKVQSVIEERRSGSRDGRSGARGRSLRSAGTGAGVDVDGEAADAGAPDDVDEMDDIAVGDARSAAMRAWRSGFRGSSPPM